MKSVLVFFLFCSIWHDDNQKEVNIIGEEEEEEEEVD
jgi:hypothetical protein